VLKDVNAHVLELRIESGERSKKVALHLPARFRSYTFTVVYPRELWPIEVMGLDAVQVQRRQGQAQLFEHL